MNRREFLALPAAAAVAPARLATDFQRPRYHFLPTANWMNDPNGPIWWKGKYHLFYQYNPNGAFWGTMHWGHGASRDLVHWEHLPVAFAPTPGGPDKDGVFTGSAVIHNGVPTVLYTGVRPEVQCLATSDDDLIVWKKYPGNPVIASPPPGIQPAGFRDPALWQEQDGWYLVVGSGNKGVGPLILLYHSTDLVHWKYLHPLFSGKPRAGADPRNAVASGEMWECPDFFPLGGKHVLIVSTEGTTRYWIGTYRDHRFQAESDGILDPGAFYAPKSIADATGRRVLWGWIQERRSVEAQKAAGWSGVMSLPRILTLRPDGRLGIAPAPELEKLRSKVRHVPALPFRAPSDNFEIFCRIAPGSARQLGLDLGGLPILYDRGTEPLELRVFSDASVVEVFANGRSARTERIYRAQAGPVEISLLAKGGQARLERFDVWEIQPISTDRLTS